MDKYIDKIFVTPEDGKLHLEIKIFTGETTEKYMERFKRSTGNTSLKMMPIRTMSFYRDCRIENDHLRKILYSARLNV